MVGIGSQFHYIESSGISSKQIEPANLSKRDERTRIGYDRHSGSLTLDDFRLPFVFSEAKVGDAQLRGALDEFQAGNSQESGSLAAGDEASPVQLEHDHFTRRLPDRLAQSLQETAKVFAEIQNRGIHRGCSSFIVPLARLAGRSR